MSFYINYIFLIYKDLCKFGGDINSINNIAIINTEIKNILVILKWLKNKKRTLNAIYANLLHRLLSNKEDSM